MNGGLRRSGCVVLSSGALLKVFQKVLSEIWEPKESQKRAKREPKGAKREPKGCLREPKGRQKASQRHIKINLRKRSRKGSQKGGPSDEKTRNPFENCGFSVLKDNPNG